MTSVALPRADGRVAAPSDAMRRIAGFFFLATLFCCTFEKVHWTVPGAGDVNVADLLALGFLAGYAILSRPRVPQTTAVVLVFFAAFLIAYLCGFYNLETHQALSQYTKGLVKFVIHFVFLAVAVAWLYRRGAAYYWHALAWFFGGIAANALYGVFQLVAAWAGFNLDAAFVQPLTGGASKINIYGAVEGSDVFRPNALSGDPNHLAIMLIVPLLVLTPIYLRLGAGHRLRARIGGLLAFLLVVEIATLSRSGLLGLGVGALVLMLPYRHYLRTKLVLYPLAGVLGVIAVFVVVRWHYVVVVFRSRTQTGGNSTNVHLQVYDYIPQILRSHPLFGLGYNNFSVFYEQVTGKTNWGPHSFYAQLLIETGLVGTALFAVFLLWVFRRLGVARRIGAELVHAGDPRGRRVRPLAWGMTAALAGTMAANVFYLTMGFYYFYAFLAFALAAPLVFRQPRAR
jgi:O-antigen ligase